MRRFLLALVLTVFALTVVAANAATPKRAVPSRAQIMNMQTTAPTGRIVVKFTDDSKLLVTEAGLTGQDEAVRARIAALLQTKAQGRSLERRFEADMAAIDAQRLRAEAKAGLQLPNLNRYGQIDLGEQASREELMQVLKEILADPAVEVAFLEPKAVPAALGFDAFTGTYTPTQAPAMPGDIAIDLGADDGLKSPDYSNQQHYLGAPPYGVNALAVDGQPGARGADMHLVDIEGAWLWDHEDLPAPFYTRGVPSSEQDWRDHGTAVLGEIRGHDDGSGVRGIAPEVAVGACSAMTQSVSSCITYASLNVNEGDVVVIELHAPGPNSTGSGQFGYVCMEYWQDNFDAILVASADGRVVCEAAGNGYQDLDSATYGNLFDRDYRDSGAVMCGAANATVSPYDFSNYGSRLDLNGWGGLVVTCGYGDLHGAPTYPETEWYTQYFSGTSSATPIVAGAVVAFQGMVKAVSAEVLSPFTLRDMMTASGTPQQSGHQVGPRPDIVEAFNAYGASLGNISGTVTEAGTGTLLENVLVTLQETGDTFLTGPDGTFNFDTFVGSFNLEFDSFHHEVTTLPLEVTYGVPANGSIALTRLPHITIVGSVMDTTGTTQADVRCSVLSASPASVMTDALGKFTLADIPIGPDFALLFDGKPGFGVDYIPVTAQYNDPGIWPVHGQLYPATYRFQYWPETFVPDGNWIWGPPTVGPASGFGDDNCLGIGLTGSGFGADGEFYLNSPSLNYSAYDQVYLSFHYYCDLEEGVDGVKLQFLPPGDDPIDLVPLNDYSHDYVSALDSPGWSGSSGGWRGAIFDLSGYTDVYLTYRWVLMSDSDVNDGYFLIDDVTYFTGYSLTPVPEEQLLPTITKPVLVAQPNPFNPQTSLHWSIAQAGHLDIQVYDARGRLVRTLADGYSCATSGVVLWDGRDNGGRGLSSGTYLVRVRDGHGRATTTAVSLIK